MLRAPVKPAAMQLGPTQVSTVAPPSGEVRARAGLDVAVFGRVAREVARLIGGGLDVAVVATGRARVLAWLVGRTDAVVVFADVAIDTRGEDATTQQRDESHKRTPLRWT